MKIISFLLLSSTLIMCSKDVLDIPAILLDTELHRPHVVSSNPSITSVYLAQGSGIFLDFSEIMDKESTRNAFSLLGATTVVGDFRWDSKRLNYDLQEDLATGQPYTLLLRSTAQSIDGIPMEIDYIVHFVSGDSMQSPRVVSSSPQNGAQYTDPNASIHIRFDSLMQRSSVENAFEIRPSSPGSFIWDVDGEGFVYTPFSPFVVGSTYSVTITTNAQNAAGVALDSVFHLNFQAGTDFESPELESIYESGETTALASPDTIAKESFFRFSFSEPMDYETTENALTLRKVNDGTTVSGVFVWDPSFLRFRFSPNEALEPETLYRLVIHQSATDLSGNRLRSQYTYELSVESPQDSGNSNYLRISESEKILPLPLTPLAVDSHLPTDVSVTGCAASIGSDATLRLSFDHSLDLNSIAENISLQRILGPHRALEQIIGFEIETSFLPNDTIRLQVDGLGCLNEYEITLRGGRNGLLSESNGLQVGTWLSQNIIIPFRVIP